MAILKERLGEFQESIGAKLLPVMGNLLTMVLDVAKGFGGEDPEGLSERARELAGDFEGNGANSLGGSLRAVANAFTALYTVITEDGDPATTSLQSFADSLESVANGINAIAEAYRKGANALQFINKVDQKVADFLGVPQSQRGTMGSLAAGGPVAAGGAYRVGEFGPELFVPSGSGSIRKDTGDSQGNTFIFNGVIDGESARRSIEKLLQDSARRTGAVNFVGATL
jgi:hypothetical protein